MSFNSVHMEGFDEMSPTQMQAFDSFIKYAQAQGTTVILVLSPWHPYLYDYLLTEPENHKGFFEVENWVREYCSQNNIPLYGSYDPTCIEGLQETDFFDGLHCSGTGIVRFFFPGAAGPCRICRTAPCRTRLPYTHAPAWRTRRRGRGRTDNPTGGIIMPFLLKLVLTQNVR